jgi:mRNA interferase HigB
VRIISRKRLREFADRHPDAAQPLNAWHAIMKGSAFDSPHDVRAAFASASFLGGSKTVFNIGGNKYRLVAHMRYDLGRVYVRSVLTHAEYDRRSLEGGL